MLRSVVGGSEGDAFVIHIGLEREHLEATGVRERETLPAGKCPEPSETCDGICAWTQHQVVGISQHDLRSELFVVLCTQVLDGTAGAHRHERGSHVRTAGQGDDAGTRGTIGRTHVGGGAKHRGQAMRRGGRGASRRRTTGSGIAPALRVRTDAANDPRRRH